jgi:hypothetical protein
MFGELPAWGLYIRHAANVTLKNVKLFCHNPDYRPGIVADDLHFFKAGKLNIQYKNLKAAAIILRDVKTRQVYKVTSPLGVPENLKLVIN